MSYTTNRQPQGLSKEAEILLRNGLIGELVAINDYAHFISLTNNKAVIDIFADIMGDEKRHYGMFLNALRELDKEEYTQFIDAKSTINIPCKNKYTDVVSGKGKNYELLTLIRNGIKGEQEAIALYQDIIDNLQDKNLIQLVNSIKYEEKEHTEQLTRALLLLDNTTYGPITLEKYSKQNFRK